MLHHRCHTRKKRCFQLIKQKFIAQESDKLKDNPAWALHCREQRKGKKNSILMNLFPVTLTV